MMPTVYLVNESGYEDAEVTLGVFSTEAKAKAFLGNHAGTLFPIREWQIDDPSLGPLREIWTFTIDGRGNTINECKSLRFDDGPLNTVQKVSQGGIPALLIQVEASGFGAACDLALELWKRYRDQGTAV